MNKVLITGASGFVGRALVARLLAEGQSPAVAVRQVHPAWPQLAQHRVAAIDAHTDWSEALAGQDTVIHCAARVHVMRDTCADPLAAFRAVNLEGTRALARQAAQAGVKRLVFVSSIGVNGAETHGHPFTEERIAAPHTPYAMSKHEAELALADVAAMTGLECVVVRPPLIYGPAAPGNFGVLVKALERGLPLPFRWVRNRRAYVGLDNLVDFLLVCATHAAAANQTFLVSDGEDLSTPDLLSRTGLALGRPASLWPVPPAWLVLGARLARRPELAQRLCASLEIDIGKARRLLAWQPPVSVDEGLRRAVKGPLNETPV